MFEDMFSPFTRTLLDLLKFTISLLLVVVIGNFSVAAVTVSCPNVLLICVDDLRNCLELDGDPIARTPSECLVSRVACSARPVPALGPHPGRPSRGKPSGANEETKGVQLCPGHF